MDDDIQSQIGRVPHLRWRTWPGIIIGLPVWVLAVSLAVFLTWPIFVYQWVRGEWPPPCPRK